MFTRLVEMSTTDESELKASPRTVHFLHLNMTIRVNEFAASFLLLRSRGDQE